MKLAHISDLHLGKSFHEFDIIEDQEYILSQIADICVERKVEVLMIAGDIYDVSVGSADGMRVFDGFLKRCVDANIKVLIISGNHDNSQRISFAGSFMEPKIYISEVYEGKPPKHIVFTDEYGDVNFYLLPFLKPSDVRYYLKYNSVEIKSYEDALRHVVESIGIDPLERNVILCHQNILGAKFCSEEETQIGGLDAVSAEVFKDFDYVALGHIHRPQRISVSTDAKIVYSGSILKYSADEHNVGKSIPIIEIKEKGNIDIERVPLVPKREVREVRGLLKDILQRSINDAKKDDFIMAVLEDDTEQSDAIALLKRIYPYVAALSYQPKNKEARNDSSAIEEDGVKSFDPLDMIREFYLLKTKEQMSEDEEKLVNELIGKIWMSGGDE